jgi:hypothetical protein
LSGGAGADAGTAGSEADDLGVGASGTSGDDPMPFDAPDNGLALLTFLRAGGYATWQSEPDFHVSSGPHGGVVRVFYSPRAAAALNAKQRVFPAGSATIKESASANGSIIGWSVWVKVQGDSDSGNGFYWYEVTLGRQETRVAADSRGSSACIGCHSAGADYLRSAGTFE